jgi:tRNA/tmRNA/rRNA uracil-C5-methylase (TrmA/RlmC/RlmD family)
VLLREAADGTVATDPRLPILSRGGINGDLLFEHDAGGFFQCNDAILPRLVAHVAAEATAGRPAQDPARRWSLLDMYCGSGVFAVSCASFFYRVYGVEVG